MSHTTTVFCILTFIAFVNAGFFQNGDQVMLNNSSFTQFNGQLATVIYYDDWSDDCVVQLKNDRSSEIQIHSSQLLLAEPHPINTRIITGNSTDYHSLHESTPEIQTEMTGSIESIFRDYYQLFVESSIAPCLIHQRFYYNPMISDVILISDTLTKLFPQDNILAVHGHSDGGFAYLGFKVRDITEFKHSLKYLVFIFQDGILMSYRFGDAADVESPNEASIKDLFEIIIGRIVSMDLSSKWQHVANKRFIMRSNVRWYLNLRTWRQYMGWKTNVLLIIAIGLVIVGWRNNEGSNGVNITHVNITESDGKLNGNWQYWSGFMIIVLFNVYWVFIIYNNYI